jgi:hypothetical protein
MSRREQRPRQLSTYHPQCGTSPTVVPTLGEFEKLVLLALVRLGSEAYGATIRREIEVRAHRFPDRARRADVALRWRRVGRDRALSLADPCAQASVLRPVDALKTGGKSMTDSGLQTFSARTTLVTVQIALALILVIGAGLMSKSGSRLYATGIDVNPTIGLPSFPPRSCTCATARRGGPFAAFSRTRSRAGLVRLESARPRINH